jgi:hypothetical protein
MYVCMNHAYVSTCIGICLYMHLCMCMWARNIHENWADPPSFARHGAVMLRTVVLRTVVLRTVVLRISHGAVVLRTYNAATCVWM